MAIHLSLKQCRRKCLVLANRCVKKKVLQNFNVPVGKGCVFPPTTLPRRFSATVSTNLAKASTTTQSQYDQAFQESVCNPEGFWSEAAEKITWMKKWDRVLDASDPVFPKWFVGGEMSMTYNCLDRHLENGLGDELAVIHDSPVTNTVKKLTYNQIHHEVTHLAGALSRLGVAKGDCVLIYMPMVPEVLISMLAITRLGAYHSLVFGGFASKELAARIGHAKPKVIIGANYGKEPLREVDYHKLLVNALNMTPHKPQTCVIYNRPGHVSAPMRRGLDVDYDEIVNASKPHDCVPVSSLDPLYILYTSGTTGLPKAVVRATGGHAVSLYWTMYHIFGVKPRETWWAASDFGWVVGHSYITYGPMMHCNPTIIYEGKPVGTPDASAYWRVLSEHNVSSMFCAPTSIRAIRKEDPEHKLGQKYSTKTFRHLFLAGEHCDADTLHWAKRAFGVPVLDHWWQTESGSPITSTCAGLGMGLHPTAGVSGKPVPGWDVRVLKEDGTETAPGELGKIVVKCPLPPGAFSTLYLNDDGFRQLYFSKYKGCYDTMDAGLRDADGYIYVMSRVDDVINVAGHRLSAGGIEQALLEHPDVADAAVIGIPDPLKGHVPLGLLVINVDCKKSESALVSEVCDLVRRQVGPVASFKRAVVVDKLPKTRSGKVARHTLAAMAAGLPFKIPVTIEDAGVYADIKIVLIKAGLSPSEPTMDEH